MGMDTWYDLQLQELVDLNDRASDLVDEAETPAGDGAPQGAPREREPVDLTDRVSSPLPDTPLPETGLKDHTAPRSVRGCRGIVRCALSAPNLLSRDASPTGLSTGLPQELGIGAARANRSAS